MSRFLATILVASFLLLSLPDAAQAQKVDLRPRWEKGQQIRFRMELKSNNAVGMGEEAGSDQQQGVTQDIRLLFRVVDAKPESDATVELVYEKLKVSMTTPVGTFEFDTDQPKEKDAGNTLAPGFRALAGTVLTLTIDPDGNIKNVSGGEALSGAGLAGRLSQPGDLKDLIGPIMTPKRSPGVVSVGQSWENVDTIDSGFIGRFKLTTKHTVKSANANAAEVDVSGRFDKDSEAPSGSAFQIKAGKFDGRYTWDTAKGMLKKMDTTQSFKIEGAMGEQKISVSNDTTMKITRID